MMSLATFLLCLLSLANANSKRSQWNLLTIAGSRTFVGATIDYTGQNMIVYDDKNVWYSNDFLQTWRKSAGVSCLSSCNLFGVSKDGRIIYKFGVESFQKSTDYGQTFSSLSARLTTPVSITTDLTGKNVLIAEELLLISSDYGVTFRPTTAPVQRYCALTSDDSFTYHVAISTRDSILASPYIEVYYSHDAGTSWTLVNSNSFSRRMPEMQHGTSSPYVTSDASGKYVAITGLGNSFIFHSFDYGETWKPAPAAPSGIHWNFNAIRLTSGSSGQKIAIVDGSGLFLSSDYGENWLKDLDAPSRVTYKSLLAIHNFDRLYLLTSAGLYVRGELSTRDVLAIGSSLALLSPNIAPTSTPPTVTPSLPPSLRPSFTSPTLNPSVKIQLTKGNLYSRKKLNSAALVGITVAFVIALFAYLYAFQPSSLDEETNETIEIEIP
jgi:hypothetical protein